MINDITKKYDNEIDFYTKMSEIAQNSNKIQEGENSKIAVIRWYKSKISIRDKRNSQKLESLDDSSKTPKIGPEFTPSVIDSTAAIAYIFNLALQNQGIGRNENPFGQETKTVSDSKSPTHNTNYNSSPKKSTVNKQMSEATK
jgi:hypothetical protein